MVTGAAGLIVPPGVHRIVMFGRNAAIQQFLTETTKADVAPVELVAAAISVLAPAKKLRIVTGIAHETLEVGSHLLRPIVVIESDE